MASPGFKIADAQRFAAAEGLLSDAQAIMGMQVDPRIKKRHVPKKGALVKLFEQHGVMEAFVAKYWPLRHTHEGELRRQQYLDYWERNESLLQGEPPDEDDNDDGPTPDVETYAEATMAAFAMEGHLRDFIIENLPQISIGGTRLALYRDAKGREGKEYPTGVGQIDILAVDSSGQFYIFELKLDRGPDRALGQLARYMGWVKMHLASGQEVRGVVVARSIDEKLRYAACVIPNVALMQYEVSFQLQALDSLTVQPNPHLELSRP